MSGVRGGMLLWAAVVGAASLFYVRKQNHDRNHSLYHCALEYRHPEPLNARDFGGKRAHELAGPDAVDQGTSKLGEEQGVVKEGLLFRTAWPGWAEEEALEKFWEEKNIHLILDIRSRRERDETLEHEGKLLIRFQESAQQVPPFTTPTRLHVPYMPVSGLVSYVFPRIPVRTAVYMIWHKIIATPEYETWGDLLELFNVEGDGLAPVYIMFFESSFGPIVEVLRAILWAAEEGKPALIHCMAGKDRTGITSALIYMLLGVKDQEIIADYAESENRIAQSKQIDQALEKNANTMHGPVFGPPFMSSKPSYIEKFIHHINTQRGGIAECLTMMGFSPGEQERFRAAFIQKG